MGGRLYAVVYRGAEFADAGAQRFQHGNLLSRQTARAMIEDGHLEYDARAVTRAIGVAETGCDRRRRYALCKTASGRAHHAIELRLLVTHCRFVSDGRRIFSQTERNDVRARIGGALDEITRNRLDADLLDLWWRKHLTVMFVTHSIYEAVFLSTRVVVMSARPGRVFREIAIDEPHPRSEGFRVTQQFAAYARQLSECLAQASAEGAGVVEGTSLEGAGVVANSSAEGGGVVEGTSAEDAGGAAAAGDAGARR